MDPLYGTPQSRVKIRNKYFTDRLSNGLLISTKFNNAEIIDKGNSPIRKILESWHTAKTVEADNNSCPLPGQYNILLNKH